MRPSQDASGQNPLHGHGGAGQPKLDLAFSAEERRGLTTAQAEELQRTVGFNELPAIEVSKLYIFFLQFTGTMPYMLEIACIISAACKDFADLGIILAMLICNGVVAFREELECIHSLVRFASKLSLISSNLLFYSFFFSLCLSFSFHLYL